MTEFFQDGKEDNSDDKLIKYRILQCEKAVSTIPQVLDEIKAMLAKIDTRMALGDRRMENHSEMLKALDEETETIRLSLRDEVKVAVESAVQNRGTFWTAAAGAVTGVPAALYAVYLMFKGNPS